MKSYISKISLALAALALLWAVTALAQDAGQSADKAQPADPAAQQARINKLIEQIEYIPDGIMVNRAVTVVTQQDRKQYNPDGTYNHNFKVNPDYSAPAISRFVKPDAHRMGYTNELIKIGKPAVPALMLAVCQESHKFREYYCIALGQIKDLRAVAALLHYYQDGVEQFKVAKGIRSMGDEAWAVKVETRGRMMKDQALVSLRSMTGQDLGDDIKAWERWWESKKKQVGPIPPLTTYTANPEKTRSPGTNPPVRP